MTDRSNFKNLHCLIVDDDRTFLAMIEAMLKSLGIGAITSGRSGSEALTILTHAQRPVDVVLCDFSMESGNGFQLLKSIRLGQVKYVRPDACFIMVTSFADPELVKLAAKLDANGYLIKPTSPERLETAIIKGRSKAFAIDPVRYAQADVSFTTL